MSLGVLDTSINTEIWNFIVIWIFWLFFWDSLIPWGSSVNVWSILKELSGMRSLLDGLGIIAEKAYYY